MKRRRNSLKGVSAAIGFLILIFDSSLALEGAKSGIELCIKTVIPSLFPFFVLSMILTNILSDWTFKPAQVLTAALGIPKTAAAVWVPSLLGGYPVGAKCISDLYQRNQISKKEAERLLSFGNNAGPSFLFGMVSGFFPEKVFVWLLWLVHILSAGLTAAAVPAIKSDKQTQISEKKSESTAIIWAAAKAICMVCCWVILFRIILSFLNTWFFRMLPDWTNVLLTGFLELTNGCCALLLIVDVKLRFVICSCLLAFGGICVLLQTASVTQGLHLGYYLKGKLMQTAFSFLISCALVTDYRWFFTAMVPLLLIILRKIQNKDSILRTLPV